MRVPGYPVVNMAIRGGQGSGRPPEFGGYTFVAGTFRTAFRLGDTLTLIPSGLSPTRERGSKWARLDHCYNRGQCRLIALGGRIPGTYVVPVL